MVYSSRYLLRLLVFILQFLYSPWSMSLEAPLYVTGARTVNAAQAMSLYEDGAVFIDVRDDEEWFMGHIDGAIHLDLRDDFEKLYHVGSETKSIPIVIYCNSDECLRGAYASAISVSWGYSNVYYFRGGYFAWLLADYPLQLKSMAQY